MRGAKGHMTESNGRRGPTWKWIVGTLIGCATIAVASDRAWVGHQLEKNGQQIAEVQRSVAAMEQHFTALPTKDDIAAIQVAVARVQTSLDERTNGRKNFAP